jgi:hypothetical protein
LIIRTLAPSNDSDPEKQILPPSRRNKRPKKMKG